jgi:hypothetical protein
MNFEQLRNFIKKEMRMAHIYQPVMIREIIKGRGKAPRSHGRVPMTAGKEYRPPQRYPHPKAAMICRVGSQDLMCPKKFSNLRFLWAGNRQDSCK